MFLIIMRYDWLILLHTVRHLDRRVEKMEKRQRTWQPPSQSSFAQNRVWRYLLSSTRRFTYEGLALTCSVQSLPLSLVKHVKAWGLNRGFGLRYKTLAIWYNCLFSWALCWRQCRVSLTLYKNLFTNPLYQSVTQSQANSEYSVRGKLGYLTRDHDPLLGLFCSIRCLESDKILRPIFARNSTDC